MDREGFDREIERELRVSHLRFERKEDLRWQRGDVITVGESLLLIGEWVSVRRLVLWPARS